MKINKEVLDRLSAEAAKSPRLRFAEDMRNSPDDKSQRLLNAMEPGTVVPIHRHVSTNETLFVIRGRACEIFYDNNGRETERIELAPGGECPGINVPKGQFHTILALEPGTVIFEAKDGPYTPLSAEDIIDGK